MRMMRDDELTSALVGLFAQTAGELFLTNLTAHIVRYVFGHKQMIIHHMQLEATFSLPFRAFRSGICHHKVPVNEQQHRASVSTMDPLQIT